MRRGRVGAELGYGWGDDSRPKPNPNSPKSNQILALINHEAHLRGGEQQTTCKVAPTAALQRQHRTDGKHLEGGASGEGVGETGVPSLAVERVEESEVALGAATIVPQRRARAVQLEPALRGQVGEWRVVRDVLGVLDAGPVSRTCADDDVRRDGVDEVERALSRT